MLQPLQVGHTLSGDEWTVGRRWVGVPHGGGRGFFHRRRVVVDDRCPPLLWRGFEQLLPARRGRQRRGRERQPRAARPRAAATTVAATGA